MIQQIIYLHPEIRIAEVHRLAMRLGMQLIEQDDRLVLAPLPDLNLDAYLAYCDAVELEIRGRQLARPTLSLIQGGLT